MPHDNRSLDTLHKIATILAMPKSRPFEIVYDEVTVEHLDAIEKKYISAIRNSIETHLRFEPHVEARNRKLLQAPSTIGATWELRCGPNNRFRVFHDVHPKDRRVVILAIAVKLRSELWIGKERFER
jgi:hypothetical protein